MKALARAKPEPEFGESGPDRALAEPVKSK